MPNVGFERSYPTTGLFVLTFFLHFVVDVDLREQKWCGFRKVIFVMQNLGMLAGGDKFYGKYRFVIANPLTHIFLFILK